MKDSYSDINIESIIDDKLREFGYDPTDASIYEPAALRKMLINKFFEHVEAMAASAAKTQEQFGRNLTKEEWSRYEERLVTIIAKMIFMFGSMIIPTPTDYSTVTPEVIQVQLIKITIDLAQQDYERFETHPDSEFVKELWSKSISYAIFKFQNNLFVGKDASKFEREVNKLKESMTQEIIEDIVKSMFPDKKEP